MYKLLLCWRYLRTRYIALASIVSVTLGVATMIVVNSVMSGFSHEMMDRMRGILSDVVFEGHSLNGFPDADWHMAEIRRVAGEHIAGMTPTVHVPAMLSFRVQDQWINRQIMFIGIDERTHSSVSDFSKYLQHPANRDRLSFDLRDGGYDVRDHQGGDEMPYRPDLENAGWKYRRWRADQDKVLRRLAAVSAPPPAAPANGATAPSGDVPPADNQHPVESRPINPFLARDSASASSEDEFDPARDTHTGIVVGKGLISVYRGGTDRFLIVPGDDVQITAPNAPGPGSVPKGATGSFTVVDVYESKMSEYDSSFVFVPLEQLQQMRGMIDPSSQIANVTAIQIKLKNPADGDLVRDKLRAAFDPRMYGAFTWKDKQGAILAAVEMESAVLNILLFLIIAVAGFGILAIFFMIVVEKTRDVGILKSLGASSRGIMSIFLTYGLSLGVVGSGAGMILGLLFVRYINQIRDWLEVISGRRVFDPSIYYFYKIPTIVEPLTVTWIVLGALGIAVLASVLPARRAASLHPVEALRYE